MPKFLDRIRSLFGRRPAATGARLYSGARHTQSTWGFGGGNSSADAELATALPILRSRARQLMRDSAYARRARTVIVNNVVGAGVGMQAQVMTTRDVLADRVNDDIETQWWRWSRAENCHAGGALAFGDLERVAMAEIVTAGEVLIRKHRRPFGSSAVPFALEVIEAERLADELSNTGQDSSRVRMGVEVDDFGRAVAYWIKSRHPGDTRWAAQRQMQVERVPAEDVYHLRVITRWPQTRGEPWLHAVCRKLDNMDQYSMSEVEAARANSYWLGTIESGDPDGNPLATATTDGSTAAPVDIEANQITQLAPGEKLNLHTPTRPNTAIDPFLRYMLREVAAGIDVSYESLSRDYSQSNYSSSRLSLLDDRDTWRMLQQWWIRSFREPLHREWLRAAVLSRAVQSIPVEAYAADPERYSACLFKPRGWSWIDPTKEVTAYKEAIKAGLTTLTDVIAQTADGRDIEDVIKTRKRELDMLEAADIDVDTTVEDPQEAPEPAMDAAPEPPDDSPEDDPEDGTETNDTTRPERVVSFRRQ